MSLHRYSAYGLSIASELELPEFDELDHKPMPVDVRIRFGSVQEDTTREVPREYGSAYLADNRVYYRHALVGLFEMTNGNVITIQRGPDYDEGFTRMCITNLALGVILHQREVFTLHASAVEVQGEAVVFLGDKGAGKSTMATAMSRHGHALITDDVLGILTSGDDGVRVLPGYAQVKLLPDAVSNVLEDNPENYQQVYQQTSKRVHRVEGKRHEEPIPLRSIYVLREDKEIRIDPLAPRDAFFTLMRQAYLRRLVGPTRAAQWYTEACSNVVNEAGIYTLSRPKDFSLVPLLVRSIRDNIEGLVQLTEDA